MINQVTLIGRVGKDPETRQTNNGMSVTTLTLATSETYKNKQGQKVENTEWHNVVFFDSLSDIVEKYVKKGDLIHVNGKIKTRSWDDKDGNKRYITEIISNQMTMLGGKKQSDAMDFEAENSGHSNELFQ